MYSVYQHWDPLKVCVVGKSYPPEFYSWIKIPHVRQLFEKIAIETEEDYQNIITKLQEFGVEVLRPKVTEHTFVGGRHVPPPMTPRDYTMMSGTTFYENYSNYSYVDGYDKNYWNTNEYNAIRDASWPDVTGLAEFGQLPNWIQQECREKYNYFQKDYQDCQDVHYKRQYDHILEHIKNQGNQIKHHTGFESANCARIGQDLYFGTHSYRQNTADLSDRVNREFTQTRNHIVNTGGHSDGTYCPVCPGLIISL